MAEWVEVSELLKKLKCSVDMFRLREESEWFRMLSVKCGDDQFATLVRLIESEGFTDPIGIRFGREIKSEEDREYYDVQSDDDWIMGNGHHRLCAAILLGMDKILVQFGTSWPLGDRYYDVQNKITGDDRSDSGWIWRQIGDSEIGQESELVSA